MRSAIPVIITLFIGCGHVPKAPALAVSPGAQRASPPVPIPAPDREHQTPTPRSSTAAPSSTPKTPPSLNRDGLGPLHTGSFMDESAVRALFPGATIKRIVLDDGEGGGWPAIEIRGSRQLAVDLRLSNERIEEIWLMDSGIATSEGVRVGDPLAAVIRLGDAISCIESAEGAASVFCSMKGTPNMQYVMESTNTTGIPQPVQVSTLAARKITAIRVLPSRL